MLNPKLNKLLECIEILDGMVGGHWLMDRDYEKADSAKDEAKKIINELQEIFDNNHISML